MTCPKNNKDCVSHTIEAHNNCPLTGSNACKDYSHKKECWMEAEVKLLNKVLDNYFPE